MTEIQERLHGTDWENITETLHEKGYAIIPGILEDADCRQLIKDYSNDALYRKTIVMERYRFGAGEYKYFNYPLPPVIQQLRETIYPYLSSVANVWMKALSIETSFPHSLAEMQQLCSKQGQTKPAVLILKYGVGGHNTLHQDLYGDVWFPLQAVLFLNEPGSEYTGGEFVMTQQTPRAQSKAIVLSPAKGDLLIFTTNFRPARGSKGYYRVQMKHGVSELHMGERHTVGIIFHDAAT
ncbi:2OG-Fe(II) oxygenase [Chitinophagaceae bacterium MMS25-I14]